MELISPIAPEQYLPKTFLDSSGGFAWWYVDIVNEDGDGVVLIYAFGLPFLPGYAHAARQKKAQTPASRPSLNVAVYQRGVPVFYSLQEFAPDDASWAAERQLSFGRSTFDLDAETGVCVAHLHCPVPGSNDALTGTVTVRGSIPKVAYNSDFDSHLWGPVLVPALGNADLVIGNQSFVFEGDGYVDRNGSELPLHDLGFSSWTWGRVREGSTEKVYYILWPSEGGDPTAIGFEFTETETRRVVLEAEFTNPRTSFGGMPWLANFSLTQYEQPWLSGTCASVLDDGPFYVRGQFRTGSARGVFEWCEPDRVDLTRHRFLVNMRVQNPRRNSMWVPLFTGPTTDRISRLLTFWRGA